MTVEKRRTLKDDFKKLSLEGLLRSYIIFLRSLRESVSCKDQVLLDSKF